MRRLIATVALLLALPILGAAQDADHDYHGQGYAFLAFAPAHLSLAVPGSATVGLAASTNAHQFGWGGEFLAYKGVGIGGELLSSTQPFEGSSLETWIGSVNVSYHFGSSRKKRVAEPFVTGGYTFYYVSNITLPHETGGNVGVGVNIWVSRLAALRLEIRDDIGGQFLSAEFQPSGTYFLRPSQHLVGFRIGVTFR
ncbi:MAG TPA: hypothetical protein VEO19_10560 [Terriglobia bacterium]|nr:hypothetical protein [Terriglobia bacterium]